MTEFHIVYTAGTVRALLPLAFSLLQSPAARFLLVDNGCEPEESELMRRAADSEERFSYYRLPFGNTVRHGVALDHLFARSDDPHFAIIDSDIFATGDFLAELEDRPPASGGVCSGWPVWIEDSESVCTRDQVFLGGPYRTLADGTPGGGTSCALYDRPAMQSALDVIEVGLSNQIAGALGNDLRSALATYGWSFERYGTARIAHLQLFRQGNPVVNRDCSLLHHLGGLSHTADVTPGRVTQRIGHLAALFTRGNRSLAVNLLTNVKRRFSASGQRQSRIYARKKIVVTQVSAWMRSLDCREPLLPAAPTGSDEVDVRLGRLRDALGRYYPALRDRVSAPGSGERSA